MKRQLANLRQETRVRWVTCLLAVLIATCAVSLAQGNPGPTQLRVTRQDAPPLVGAFGGLRGDTLLLVGRTDAAPQAIPLGSIASLERSTGTHGHSLIGAGIGLGAGAIAGGVLGGAIQPREGTGANANWALGGAVLLGAAGALVGALAGAAWRSEGWRPMSVQELGGLSGFRDGASPRLAFVRRF